MKLDYVILANKKAWERFRKEHKSELVNKKVWVNFYQSRGYFGEEYEIDGETVVLLLDYEVDYADESDYLS